MLDDEPEHCAGTMLSVLEGLWKARTLLLKHGIDPWGADRARWQKQMAAVGFTPPDRGLAHGE